jgi:hypothetical protein
MADVTTTLQLLAVDKSQTAFAQAAKNIQNFTQQTAKAHKDLAQANVSAMNQIEETGRAGMTTLNKLLGLGGMALITETIREGTLAWAKLA